MIGAMKENDEEVFNKALVKLRRISNMDKYRQNSFAHIKKNFAMEKGGVEGEEYDPF